MGVSIYIQGDKQSLKGGTFLLSAFSKEIADNYDNWYKNPLGKFVDEIERNVVMDLAKPQKNEKVLDLGCGTGIYSLLFLNMGLKVTGIDQSDFMLEKAREKTNKINFIKADAYNLPFPNESFDLVVSVTMFEFLDDPQKAAREAYRVLSPGGRLIICVIGAKSTWAKLYREKAKAENQSPYKAAKFYTLEEVLNFIPEVSPKDYNVALHFGPDADLNNKEFLLKKEMQGQREKKDTGGFICVRWDK